MSYSKARPSASRSFAAAGSLAGAWAALLASTAAAGVLAGPLPSPTVSVAVPAVPAVPVARDSGAGSISDWVSDSPWLIEPASVRRPAVEPGMLSPFPSGDRRPEPIPLPPAAVAGPIFLTALMASAVMKKRRPQRRRTW